MSEPLIFDTSVWIDFLKNKRNAATDLLAEYIERNDQVLLVPTILQEILQGIRQDAQYNHIKDILSYFTVLQIPPVQAAIVFFVNPLYHFCDILQASLTPLTEQKSLSLQSYVPIM